MGKKAKKYESGAATAFIGRNQAIKKLQLTIADFRRLSILKGIYPVEPKNKKKVNKGSTANRTFYYVKDINFLANEPILKKFRDFKVYVKRLKRAKGTRDIKGIARVRNTKPTYKVDHIVKERYPSYIDAVRDLDDCLSLIFLFAVLPKSRRVYVEKVQLCLKLSLEFMHYVIASKSLRKCFISIKGYYFQADIKGQKVTWIMPHKLVYQTPDDVDFRIMSTFVEFYSIMLGFVNYKSYQDIGLIYPPKLSVTGTQNQESNEKMSKASQNDFNEDYLSSLNCDFIKISDGPDGGVNGDVFPLADEENPEILEKAKLEQENLQKLQNLFKGLKFFLNREIPREQFVFAVRSFSGEVSWDKNTALGSTFQEDDAEVTHHIIDRPHIGKNYLNRIYVQPQWIFDCINEGMLLPVEEYLPGACLPPHLSPFVDHAEASYIPPEKQRMINLKLGIVDETPKPTTKSTENTVKKTENKIVSSQKSEPKKLAEKEKPLAVEEDDQQLGDHGMRVDIDSPGEESVDEDTEISESEEEDKTQKPKTIAVVKGKVKVVNANMEAKKAADEDKKLSELMIAKKHKRLYNKIMHSKKKTRQETEKLKEKRQKYEESKNN